MPSLLSQEFDESCIHDVMKLYKDKRESGLEYIDINRMQISVLRQIMRIYKNPKFNLLRSIDVHFQGEQCADMGGPTREFSTLHLILSEKLIMCLTYNYLEGSMGILSLCVE